LRRTGGPVWDVESGGTVCVLVADCQRLQSRARLKLGTMTVTFEGFSPTHDFFDCTGIRTQDENDEKIALRRMVAGRGILRNHGRNNNSPETGPNHPQTPRCGNGVPRPSRFPYESAAALLLPTNETGSKSSYFLRLGAQNSVDRAHYHSYLSATMGSTRVARRAGM
jgi:hypothetical protein